jgi:hypothetical protein
MLKFITIGEKLENTKATLSWLAVVRGHVDLVFNILVDVVTTRLRSR